MSWIKFLKCHFSKYHFSGYFFQGTICRGPFFRGFFLAGDHFSGSFFPGFSICTNFGLKGGSWCNKPKTERIFDFFPIETINATDLKTWGFFLLDSWTSKFFFSWKSKIWKVKATIVPGSQISISKIKRRNYSD